MLRFTAAGVVASPTTVQIRVTRSMPGRLSAGAPQPGRTLSDAELLDNLQHFTHGLEGPRTRPCTGLVLSGAGLLARPGLSAVLDRGRELGLQRIVLHGVPGATVPTAMVNRVDELSIVVRQTSDVEELRGLIDLGYSTSAVVPLDAAVVGGLDTLAGALAMANAPKVIFTWPLHGERPPPAAVVQAALSRAVLPLLAGGSTVGIKGLPGCALGELRSFAWRTSNRWYVDSDHQKSKAMLFFPDVVRFARQDECRWCRLQNACDGAPEQWLAAGLVGPLRAVPDLT